MLFDIEVKISLKGGMLNPEATTIERSLDLLGYEAKNVKTVEIIKLNGSIELAPIVGIADVICDIVETGATLRENGLDVLEEVCSLSARMVVNEVSMKMENERITKLIRDLKNVL